MSNSWNALYQGPLVVGSNSTQRPILGGRNQSVLLRQGTHPYATLESVASRKKQNEINRRKAAAERAQKEYRNSLKKLIANFTEQKRKQIASNITAKKRVNELKKMTSANWKAAKARDKAEALNKLKKNLKANRNLISNNLRANYNAWARVWIGQLFNYEFNKGYLSGANREELEESIKKVKKGLADVIAHDKQLKNLKKFENEAREAKKKANQAAAFQKSKKMANNLREETENKRRREAARRIIEKTINSIKSKQAEVNKMVAANKSAAANAEKEAKRLRNLEEELEEWKEGAKMLKNWNAKRVFAEAAAIGRLKTAGHAGRALSGIAYNISRQRAGNFARRTAGMSPLAALRAQRAARPLFGPNNMRQRPKRN